MMFIKLKQLMAIVISVGLLASTGVTAFAANVDPEDINSDKVVSYEGRTFEKESLSSSTLEWLNWYDELPSDVQEMVSYEPVDLIDSGTLKTSLVDAIEATYPDDTISSDEYSIRASETGAPVYNPSWWNDSSRIKKANCYAYAMDVIQNFEGKLQPGQLAGSQFTSLTESAIYNAVVKDGPYLGNGRSIKRSTLNASLGSKEYKVALVICPKKDYHWYVLNTNGYWSHKRGHGKVTNVDASGNKITNPKTCDRNYPGLNYSTFCNFYIITRK